MSLRQIGFAREVWSTLRSAGMVLSLQLLGIRIAMGREVFICDAVRTPIGRFGGVLARVRTDDLAAIPIRTLIERASGLDPLAIDEVVLGCANQAGEDTRNVARMSALLAGLPVDVPGVTLNRLRFGPRRCRERRPYDHLRRC